MNDFPTWSMPLWSQYVILALPCCVTIALIVYRLYSNNNHTIMCKGCGDPLDIVAQLCKLSYCLECLRPNYETTQVI